MRGLFVSDGAEDDGNCTSCNHSVDDEGDVSSDSDNNDGDGEVMMMVVIIMVEMVR